MDPVVKRSIVARTATFEQRIRLILPAPAPTPAAAFLSRPHVLSTPAELQQPKS